MNLLHAIFRSAISTARDVLPILAVVLVFQLGVLRRPIPRIRRVAVGFAMLLLGLAVFLVGLELSLFPLGKSMAEQLAAPEFVQPGRPAQPQVPTPWHKYYWTFAFAFAIAFSAVIAEPGLSAVVERASTLSGGTIHAWGMRGVIAMGSGLGSALGAIRITTGLPLLAFAIPIFIAIAALTYVAPRAIVPLAYDSGVIATSTITVPLVTALGVGLASQIPGRNPMSEGFGMIALAYLCPAITVMSYATLAEWRTPQSITS